MNEIKLVQPNIKYKKSFLEFVKDVKKTGYESYPLYVKAEDDFEVFVAEQEDQSNGINIPEDWVPYNSYWLVDIKGKVLGVIRVRHRVDSVYLETKGHIGYEIKSSHRRKGYGQRILELGLIEASKIGLENVLITCREDNTGSRRMIEKCNGKHKKSFDIEGLEAKLFQYEVQTH